MDMECDMFGPPSIKAILIALKDLENAASGPVSRSPRAELRKVIKLLEESGCNSVSEMVDELRLAPAPKAKAKPAPANAEVVESYLSKLKAANATAEDFESAVAKLLGDKKVRAKLELREIANRYTGSTASYSTKKEAEEAIKRTFHARWVSNQYKLKAG
jgi:hypothetical protein